MWRARLNRANAQHVAQLSAALRREFVRLAADLDPKRVSDAVAVHGVRLSAILAAHQRATAHTFGFLAVRMLGPRDEAKADAPEPTRAQQVAAVLLELARTVASGAIATMIAEALSRDRQIVAAVEAAILSAPTPTPSAIATTLLGNRHVASRLAVAHAIVAAGENAPSPPPNAITRGSGGANPPPPPAPPSGSPPRRSRFSELVERIVREDAPQRARQIARTSGNTIAAVLAQGAREGWSEERVRRELQKRLVGIHGEIADYRARAIARTELGSAQNAATLAIARDRAAAGARLQKVWIAIDDHRTRETHAGADNQVRALDEPFAVGRALLQHPGDPTAPLGEIINCRCAMLIQSAPAPAE